MNPDNAAAMPPGPPAVELRGLTKRFGGVLANAGVNLRVEARTVHGVIGENGAGKSTAMKMLYGLYRPDAGEIFVNGEPCQFRTPADAAARGLAMVHQHFMLAGPVSALDNILLGAEPRRWGLIDRRQARERLEALSRRYGLPVEWDRPVEQLPVGIQQRIEILKLLYRDASILILDEPTAVLTPAEAGALFTNLQKLRDEGKTVILITHKLKEVMAFTDHVTVLRAGQVTGERRTTETNPEELAELMIGRRILPRREVTAPQPRAEPALEVNDLHLAGATGKRPRLAGISFCVHRGEIVGVAGVEGNGQSELLEALLHPRDPHCRGRGMVKLFAQDVTRWSAGRIRALGVAVIPEDRLRSGLLVERPLTENFLLGWQRDKAFSHAGLLSITRLNQAVSHALREYDVRPGDRSARAGQLSGGNQQKFIVAREFQRPPRLLIASHPTRGVDIGAIEFIHDRILRAREADAAVLLVSSELDEILALSDRILVMFEGRIAAEFTRDQVTERELGLKMGGG